MSRNFASVGDGITLPAGVSLALDSAVTAVFWNFVVSNPAGGAVAFTVGDLVDPDRCQVHAPFLDGTLYWDYGNSAIGGRITTSYASYLNKWTHVALVSSGNANTFKAIYLDGGLITSAASSDGPSQAISGGFIGKRTGGEHRGRMAEFAIWSVVLSANEIKELRGSLSPTQVHPANLVGYWPLWGVASPEADLSGNARNGTVTGALRANHAPVGPHAPYIPGAV